MEVENWLIHHHISRVRMCMVATARGFWNSLTFFLTNVKFPWPTELTIAQISPDNGLSSLLRAILFTHLFMLSASHVQCTWINVQKGLTFLKTQYISILFNFTNNILPIQLAITKGCGVQATTIEGQNAFAPTLFFAQVSRNRWWSNYEGRRSKGAWSNCFLCIPFILNGSPNECWLHTMHAQQQPGHYDCGLLLSPATRFMSVKSTKEF